MGHEKFYEEKYKEALSKAKDILSHKEIRQEDIKYLFPELKKSEDDRIMREIVAALCYYRNEGNMSHTECDECKLWLKNKLKKESTNTVEIESFHEGDWVTNGMCTFKIASIENGFYYDTNNCGSDIESIDKSYHLWTIDDAKEGDILAYPDGSLVIFKYRLRGLIAGLYLGSVLFTDKIEFSRTCTILNAKPATKEQCNFLFEALEEAGYEWDNINKKVKELY